MNEAPNMMVPPAIVPGTIAPGSIAPEWAALDSRHAWHPYTQMHTAPLPVPVVSASGPYLELADGRRVLDAISSWWVTLHGHAHPAIARAIGQQAATLEQVIYAGFTHEPAARLAAELAELLPGDLDRVFYTDNGSTAVEVALKMCAGYWAHRGQPRTTFLALEGAYHGDTFGAMAVGERSVFTRTVAPLLFDVARVAVPGADTAERWRESVTAHLRSGTVAGVIVEPMILGAGGMLTWPAAELVWLAAECRAAGVPLIADEVMTGFGRTGQMFAVQHAGVVPDIICLAKGLTGGFLPLAVTACRAHIYEAFLAEDRARMLFHGHTYCANPIGCAAARASLALFSAEPVAERIAAIERVHAERLPGLLESGAAVAVRQCGTIAALDLPEIGAAGYLGRAGVAPVQAAFAAGYLLRPLGNTLYMMPPYSTTPEQLHGLYTFLADELAR